MLADLAMGDPLAGMFTAVEPGTGKVLAMSVNRRFGYDVNDPAQESVEPQRGGQPGRRLDVQGLRRRRGAGAGDPALAHDHHQRPVRLPGLQERRRAPYIVQNAGRYPPTLTMVEALIRSSNTYFVALEDQLGSVEGPVRMAQRMGLFSLDPVADQVVAENRGLVHPRRRRRPARWPWPAPTRRWRANGTQCDPTPVDRDPRLDRAPLTGAGRRRRCHTGPSCTPDAVPPAVATTLNQILVGDTALPIGTGTRAAIPGHQIAGKTGTSQNRFSVAFVGYTPQYAASVMVLNPKRNQDLGGYGGRIAAADLARRDAADPLRPGAGALPARRACRSDPTPPPPPRRGRHPPPEPGPSPRPRRRRRTRPAPEAPAEDPSAEDSPLDDDRPGVISSAARSPSITAVAAGPREGTCGRTEVSTTRSPATPRTRSSWSTTAPGSPSGPIRAVPDRWIAVVRCARIQPSRAASSSSTSSGRPGPAGDQRREGARPQQGGRQPHPLAQPPPVGLLGQVPVAPAAAAGRVAAGQREPAPALLALQPDARRQLVAVRPPGAGDPAERRQPGQDLEVPGRRPVGVACRTPCSGSRPGGGGSGRAGR